MKSMSPFIIYSKDGCVYCQKIKHLLEIYEEKYVEYKLDRDFDKAEFIDKFGEGSTFPQVIKGDVLLGGSSQTVEYLQDRQVL